MNPDPRTTLLDPLLRRNPVTVLILGVCSALAVTSQVATALVMGAALTATTCASNVAISLVRHALPRSLRLIIEITIIASLVIVVDLFLQAYAPAMSRRLSVFVGLIVTNCIVLGRAETFASRAGPWASFLDGLGNGVGYAAVLVAVAAVREVLGAGTFLGARVLPTVADGGWYEPIDLLLKPVSAFFVLALLVWASRALAPAPDDGEAS